VPRDRELAGSYRHAVAALLPIAAATGPGPSTGAQSTGGHGPGFAHLGRWWGNGMSVGHTEAAFLAPATRSAVAGLAFLITMFLGHLPACSPARPVSETSAVGIAAANCRPGRLATGHRGTAPAGLVGSTALGIVRNLVGWRCAWRGITG